MSNSSTQSPTQKLKLEREGHVAIITIDNPSANTWDGDSLSGLKTIVEALNADKDVYSLVITGAGEKFFSAGADLKMFADGDKKVARAMAELFGKAFETLADF
ncbi:MAG: enoyl-CoA hydratase/carnithine racemase, partial [Bermanella sp.]